MKTPVYLWTDQARIINFKALHDTHPGHATEKRIIKDGDDERIMTFAENAANVLSVLPYCDVEALLKILVQSAKFSQELNESDADMLNRMYTDAMKLTTEYKSQFS